MGWAKILPAFVFLLAAGCDGYSLNTCYCWTNLTDDSYLMSLVTSFNPAPMIPIFSYSGVQFETGNTSSPCQCNDVSRTQLNVTLLESWAFQAATANDPASLNIVQEGLLNTLSQVDVNYTLASVSATLLSIGSSPSTNWTLEVITKGYDPTANLTVLALLSKNLTMFPNGTFYYPNVGMLTTTGSLAVLQCLGNPPPASPNGQRNWNSLNFPGVTATYSCHTNYFISDPSQAYSVCSHDYINWTVPAINLTCALGCQSNPPKGPYFTIRHWISTQRHNGDSAYYMCMNGYQSIDGTNGSSTCQPSIQNWTAVQSSFKCKQILCPVNILQVPAFAKTDWDGQTVYIGTRITYTCIDNFSPTVRGTITSTCLSNGTWNPLPYGYKCINVQTAIRLGIYYPGNNFAYDYYDDGIYKNKVVPVQSYAMLLSYVTIPSVIAITLVLLFLLCGTRTNSCIYWMCTGNVRKTAYIKV